MRFFAALTVASAFTLERSASRTGALSIPCSASSRALDGVELAIEASLRGREGLGKEAVLTLDEEDRESFAVATRLKARMGGLTRSGSCRSCWLQQAHCVCDRCPPVDESGERRFERIFMLTHHKEVMMAIDTAKLVLSTYPVRSRLVVAGLAHQTAEAEMIDSLERGCACVLFPSDDAVTVDELDPTKKWDVLVLDGTWSQAQRLNRRLPPGAPRVKLSASAVEHLASGAGRQLRQHPIAWREVATVEAVRLLLEELGDAHARCLRDYHSLADAAARKQLGPVRLSPRFANADRLRDLSTN